MFSQTGKPRSADDLPLSVERVADIAHELRAPLGGIEAMIDLLCLTQLDAGQERLVIGLRAAADHLRAVASDVLMTPDGSCRDLRQTAVGDVIETFAVSARARAHARSIEFCHDIGAPCADAIVSDGVGLRQILENLVDNAMRYTSAGAVTLRVLPVIDADDAPQLRFEVLDQGPGLTKDEARKIFGRRVTLAGRTAGAGLGLSIVASLVASLGGICGAAARTDTRGAHLWFNLPVTAYRATLELPQLALDLPDQRTESALPVLVVDDHPSSRLVLQTVLEHMGFVVEVTGVPAVAIRLAAEKRFAVIFTDMVMPEMDGCVMIEAIRALQPPFNLVPIIGVTGRVSAEDKRRMIASGGHLVVEKPISIAALRKAIETIGLVPPGTRDSAVRGAA